MSMMVCLLERAPFEIATLTRHSLCVCVYVPAEYMPRNSAGTISCYHEYGTSRAQPTHRYQGQKQQQHRCDRVNGLSAL